MIVVWVRTWHALTPQWIGWPSWAVWRFGQRAPEMIGFRVVEDLQHNEVERVRGGLL